MEARFNDRAELLLAQGRFAEAQGLLESAIQSMPIGWSPKTEDDRSVNIAFWDEEEFLTYSRLETEKTGPAKLIAWVIGSYSRAWYTLAAIAVEQEHLERALFCLDCGLDLEPDHPELWSEKGYVLGRLTRSHEALDCYLRAATTRNWAPPYQVARALRGQGVQLIDLDRLDEAEDALQRSLELEPDSEAAANELAYIEQARQKRKMEGERLPWFLQSILNPPSDPLTLQLMSLVEDLPPVPGPETIGTENYPRIFDAFMKHGWEGFEEEFDCIVPRNRPDYADVKRDLLREPVFRLRTHMNLAELVLGDKTVDELFDEIERGQVKKPQ